MTHPRPLIAGNWKMNAGDASGLDLAKAVAEMVTADHASVDVLVCPPAIAISSVVKAVQATALAVGAQDCHADVSGAFTGDISAEMIAATGASYVILGHSERRAGHGETDETVHAKVSASLRAGLKPIVCVGETEAERDAGQAEAVVLSQLQGSVPDGAADQGLVIAYEPVWAIGTGKVATIEDIAQMHGAIRSALEARFGAAGSGVRILYGGSMKPSNAAEILAIDTVNGGLIGGASLKAEDFTAIVNLAAS